MFSPDSHTLNKVKRLSTWVVAMAVAAAALVVLRNSSNDPEPAEEWKPVSPS